MLDALYFKWNNNSELKNRLLCTGTLRLVEHTPYDAYWGDGGGGRSKGENRLGKMLMHLRYCLRYHIPFDFSNFDYQ